MLLKTFFFAKVQSTLTNTAKKQNKTKKNPKHLINWVTYIKFSITASMSLEILKHLSKTHAKFLLKLQNSNAAL